MIDEGGFSELKDVRCYETECMNVRVVCVILVLRLKPRPQEDERRTIKLVIKGRLKPGKIVV